MTPTNELRFVERMVSVEGHGNQQMGRLVRILQQKWVAYTKSWDAEKQMIVVKEEWRDVPCVKEEA
jgi:hypothetical protein